MINCRIYRKKTCKIGMDALTKKLFWNIFNVISVLLHTSLFPTLLKKREQKL
jgi:hypothetical protein